MKKILTVFVWLMSIHAFAQDSPCDPRTTDWMPVLQHGSGTVWIKITYTKCIKNIGICGWPLVQLQHSFPFEASLYVKLGGIDCDNEPHQASFNTSGNKIASKTNYKNSGNWHIFKRVDKALVVEVDYDLGEDHFTIKKENGNIKVYKNFQLVKANGLTEKEEKVIQAKKEEEERKKKEEDLARERLRKENDKLENTIQSDIAKIPAAGPRAEMQKQFDYLTIKEMSEEERETELRSFHITVKAQARQIQKNLDTFNENKEEREDQIDNIREENEAIREEQNQIIGSMALIGAGIFSFEGRQGIGNRFTGSSYKFSIKGGLHGVMQPLGYTEYTSGTMYNYYSGNLSSINDKSFNEKILAAPGLYLTAEFHPLFSNFVSLGITGSVYYSYWPEANDGTADASFNYAGNSSTSILHYNYGAEFTLGSRPVKLLARYHIHHQDIVSSSITATSYDDGYNSMETESYYSENQTWKSHWAALGLRIGDYKRNRWLLDLAFTRNIPVSMNGIKITFKPKDLISSGSVKVPFGGYLQYSQQNGWFVRAVCTKENIIIDTEQLQLYRAEKPFFSLTIGKSLEWFGKPYGSGK